MHTHPTWRYWVRLGLAAIVGLAGLGGLSLLTRSASHPDSRWSLSAPSGEGEGPESVVMVVPRPPAEAVVAGPLVSPASFDGDLRALPQTPPVMRERPEFGNIFGPANDALASDAVDAVAQTFNGPQAMPAPIRNFAGLDLNTWGAGYPPDTNGDIGPSHYIQTVNTSIGIYDKTNGAQLAAFTFDTFFQGTGITGTPCDNDNRGDPVVLYDPQSGRWIITDFAWTDTLNGPYYECIAVSKTADPVSGGWWMYALNAGGNTGTGLDWLDDYPKLGVWNDGIYMGMNMFDCLNSSCSSASYMGARVWALNREDMISGAALQNQFYDLGNSYGSIFPTNYRGTPPPAGRPNYFLSVDDIITSRLLLWKFHVDWATPANSTFTGPTAITVASFTDPTGTVPQPNGQGLDTLGGRLMVQNQYRNINGTESIWTNHTVSNGGVFGVRWYQLNVTGNTVATTPVQQGTYQPDSNHRWMGSVAVDMAGNMAVGYSVSGSSTAPSIRYAGRLVNDPAGTLGQGETTLIAGTGSQNGINRWGDYSAMTVDPVDDCTFWYTTEYYAATGTDWQTRIGSFKFPACTTAPVLSSISDQAVLSNTVVGPITFTIADADTPIGNITVTAVSNNQTLVPNANVVLGGSGITRTVTVTPASNQTGSAVITVSADDGTAVSTSAFTVTVAAQFHKLFLPVVSRNYEAPGTYTTLMQEDFEGSFPGSWQLFDMGANAGEYYWAKRNCQAYAGSYSGWGVGGGANGSGLGCGVSYPLSVDARMSNGPFNLAGATSADLSYKLWLNSEISYDKVCHYASIDGVNFYGDALNCISGNSGGWITRTLDLSNINTLGNLLGQPNVWIMLRFVSDSSIVFTEGAYVDNIVFRKCMAATCPTIPVLVVPDSGMLVEYSAGEVLKR